MQQTGSSLPRFAFAETLTLSTGTRAEHQRPIRPKGTPRVGVWQRSEQLSTARLSCTDDNHRWETSHRTTLMYAL